MQSSSVLKYRRKDGAIKGLKDWVVSAAVVGDPHFESFSGGSFQVSVTILHILYLQYHTYTTYTILLGQRHGWEDILSHICTSLLLQCPFHCWCRWCDLHRYIHYVHQLYAILHTTLFMLHYTMYLLGKSAIGFAGHCLLWDADQNYPTLDSQEMQVGMTYPLVCCKIYYYW